MHLGLKIEMLFVNYSIESERIPSRAAVFAKESARSLPVILQCAGIHTNVTLNPSENIEPRHSFILTRMSIDPVNIFCASNAFNADTLSVA